MLPNWNRAQHNPFRNAVRRFKRTSKSATHKLRVAFFYARITQ
jgi:hypothetical protein